MSNQRSTLKFESIEPKQTKTTNESNKSQGKKKNEDEDVNEPKIGKKKKNKKK